MRKPLQRHWCQVCRLSIKLNYRLTWVANPRGQTEGKADCVFKLCFCIFMLCFSWSGFRCKSFKAKTSVFSVQYLFGLKEYLSKNHLPTKSSGTEMELPILWEYLPLLTKLICKGMWHNYSNSPDTDSKWFLSTPHSKSQKNTTKYMQILSCASFVWLIKMSSWQDVFIFFYPQEMYLFVLVSAAVRYYFGRGLHLKIMIWFCMYKVLL